MGHEHVAWTRRGRPLGRETASPRLAGSPGHPEQNGRHERMHLTLKQQATKPAAPNLLQQEGRFDAFLQQYNAERPHQALGMKVPTDLYRPSDPPDRGLVPARRRRAWLACYS